ncbi:MULTISPECIES: winged helix-turn-helix transcriptional regulator [Methanosphaera]|nr:MULTISPECIES: winged helix-turn-helix transcriptional regulator [Methanosphaera]MEE0489328.1 winged helix-turn-helix transcriptional regulator [Methanosphaera stadtmanae]
MHFKEFQEDKPKLSNKILSKRLKELESYFLVDFLRNLLILPLHF